MKKLTLSTLLLFSIFIVSSLGAAPALDAFVKKDYDKAKSHLLDELDKNGHSPLLYYNLGVTSEKLGMNGDAVYYYLQSLQMAPGFPEVLNNLEIITKRDNIKIPGLLKESGDALFITILLFFGSLYLFIFMLIFFIFKPGWKIKIALIPTFLLLILFTSLFIYRYRDAKADNYAVVINERELKSGPDEALTGIGNVEEGEILIVKDISGGWVKTKSFRDNVEGWIDMKYIKHILRRTH